MHGHRTFSDANPSCFPVRVCSGVTYWCAIWHDEVIALRVYSEDFGLSVGFALRFERTRRRSIGPNVPRVPGAVCEETSAIMQPPSPLILRWATQDLSGIPCPAFDLMSVDPCISRHRIAEQSFQDDYKLTCCCGVHGRCCQPKRLLEEQWPSRH